MSAAPHPRRTCHCQFSGFFHASRCVAVECSAQRASSGGAVHDWGQGMWEISVLSAQFCHEPKTALNSKIINELICYMEKYSLNAKRPEKKE